MKYQEQHSTQPPFSDIPRFTLAGLQEISIPAGGADTTLAKYTFRKRGHRVEKLARLDDLTEQEKAAALAFLLAYGAGVRIKRKDPPPRYETLPELEPLPDDLTGTADSEAADDTGTRQEGETEQPPGAEGTPNP